MELKELNEALKLKQNEEKMSISFDNLREYQDLVEKQRKFIFNHYEFLISALLQAVGLLSTMDQFKTKHPEEVFDWLVQEVRKSKE